MRSDEAMPHSTHSLTHFEVVELDVRAVLQREERVASETNRDVAIPTAALALFIEARRIASDVCGVHSASVACPHG